MVTIHACEEGMESSLFLFRIRSHFRKFASMHAYLFGMSVCVCVRARIHTWGYSGLSLSSDNLTLNSISFIIVVISSMLPATVNLPCALLGKHFPYHI